MKTIYIVTICEDDYHENIKAFSSYAEAEKFYDEMITFNDRKHKFQIEPVEFIDG